MAKKKAGDGPTGANWKFGEAKQRLEDILGELESNEVDIDDLAERVKEAAALIRVLNDKLTRTRAEVEQVVAELKKAAPKPPDAIDAVDAADADEGSDAGDLGTRSGDLGV